MLGIPNLVTLGVLVIWALMGVELFFATRAQLLAAGSTVTYATTWAIIKGITSPVYLAYKAIVGLVKAVVVEFSRNPTPTSTSAPTATARRKRRK